MTVQRSRGECGLCIPVGATWSDELRETVLEIQDWSRIPATKHHENAPFRVIVSETNLHITGIMFI